MHIADALSRNYINNNDEKINEFEMDIANV